MLDKWDGCFQAPGSATALLVVAWPGLRPGHCPMVAARWQLAVAARWPGRCAHVLSPQLPRPGWPRTAGPRTARGRAQRARPPNCRLIGAAVAGSAGGGRHLSCAPAHMSHVPALGDNVPMLAAGPTAHCTLGTSTHCTVGILPPHTTFAWLLLAYNTITWIGWTMCLTMPDQFSCSHKNIQLDFNSRR